MRSVIIFFRGTTGTVYYLLSAVLTRVLIISSFSYSMAAFRSKLLADEDGEDSDCESKRGLDEDVEKDMQH